MILAHVHLKILSDWNWFDRFEIISGYNFSLSSSTRRDLEHAGAAGDFLVDFASPPNILEKLTYTPPPKYSVQPQLPRISPADI